MLGLGRAIGETIAVTLVIGNAPVIGDTIFSQGYTLAAVIANEFGEAANDPTHRAALIAAGLVLFVLTLLVNVLARWFVVRGTRRHGGVAPPPIAARPAGGRDRVSAVAAAPSASPVRRRSARGAGGPTAPARGLLAGATGVALVPLVAILYYLIEKGGGAISWHFFTSDPTGSFLGDPGGIKSAILGTIAMVALATAIAVPIGIGVALYLVEYGREGRFAGVVRYFVDVMTGVPSIVFGLFVYIVLVVGNVVSNGYAAWKGAVALALLMLPVVTRSAEVVLTLVPDSLREAALALGAPRWRVVARVVLPTAAPGLITGSLLAVARAAGETAPLLFTSAVVFGTELQPRRADELDADPDLQRRGPGPGPSRRASVGHRADAGRHDPAADAGRAHDRSKEPTLVSAGALRTMTDTTLTPPPSPQPSAAAATESAAKAVELRGLRAFYGDNEAVRGVDLVFRPGQVTALIGPSGCGKSTLVRCINRMHEEIRGARAEGSVTLDGHDVYGNDVDVVAVRRAIGMVFQKPNPFPTMSIRDNVAAGLRLTGARGARPRGPRRARAARRRPLGGGQGPPRRSPASASPAASSSGCASPGRSPWSPR